MLWFKESNALDKSIYILIGNLLLSISLLLYSLNKRDADLVEWPGWKLNWFGDNKQLVFR